MRNVKPTGAMNKFAYPNHKFFSYMIVTGIFVIYMVIFASFHHQAGIGIASLAILPVIGASWYFGVYGGIFTAVLCSLSDTAILMMGGVPFTILYDNPGNLIGTFSLIFIAVVVGRLSTVTRERKDAILKLEYYELERLAHTNFLEQLNQITATALETDNLQSTLQVLTEQIAHLFDADDAFFAFWDEAQEIPIPTLAFGSLREIYSYVQFEPGEITLTTSIMKEE